MDEILYNVLVTLMTNNAHLLIELHKEPLLGGILVSKVMKLSLFVADTPAK